ncbi:MAG: hypothetical protein ACKVQC_01670 [Elusimicrobiota bacterium]
MILNPFVFQDKASIVLRAMLRDPTRKWVARDFVQEYGVSIGLVAKVLRELRNRGFIEGKDRGRLAEAVLRGRDDILKQWTSFYSMEKNKFVVLYSEQKDILKHLKNYFEKKSEKSSTFALTLHSGANLLTGMHVRDSNMYLYMNFTRFKENVLKLRQALNLKELKQGGNVFIFNPYYKNSVFFTHRSVQGFPVVSDLQLYLDLFHFPQRGLEQAEMLLRVLKQKRKHLG